MNCLLLILTLLRMTAGCLGLWIIFGFPGQELGYQMLTMVQAVVILAHFGTMAKLTIYHNVLPKAITGKVSTLTSGISLALQMGEWFVNLLVLKVAWPLVSPQYYLAKTLFLVITAVIFILSLVYMRLVEYKEPVRQTEVILPTIVPLNQVVVETPQNGVETPQNGVETPLKGVETPLKGVETPLRALKHP